MATDTPPYANRAAMHWAAIQDVSIYAKTSKQIPQLKLVLITLAQKSWDNGVTEIRQKELSALTGYSVDVVGKAIAALDGHLIKRRPRGGLKGRISDEITLLGFNHFEWTKAKSAGQPANPPAADYVPPVSPPAAEKGMPFSAGSGGENPLPAVAMPRASMPRKAAAAQQADETTIITDRVGCTTVEAAKVAAAIRKRKADQGDPVKNLPRLLGYIKDDELRIYLEQVQDPLKVPHPTDSMMRNYTPPAPPPEYADDPVKYLAHCQHHRNERKRQLRAEYDAKHAEVA